MAPGTGREKNTYREELVAVACWKLDNVRFAFGSSFVVPETRQEFRNLATLRKAYPGSPMTVFGHADPTGDDSSNKRLSGERAESIYAVLVHDTARWEKLYVRADGSRGWGRDAIETVLVTLGYPANGVKAFQEANDLRVDGVAGPRTREKLFLEYMKYLWPEKMTPRDFLTRGADKGGKGDFQGCSEFNPAVVFSKAETERFAQAENREERDAENEVNRRVMVLLFRPGFVVTPEKWPCPAVAEGMGGCRRRFWSDGEKRRSPQEERREFRVAQDTFACRFYHRLVKDSPCEGVSTGLVDLTVPLEEDLDADPERPDRVRLRAEEGGYVSVVTVGDPDAVKDGENPLYYYTFRDVPAGFYSIDVKTGGRWRVVLRGLRVDGSGAYWGGRRFVGEVDGAELGTGESGWVADMPEFEEPDYGFR